MELRLITWDSVDTYSSKRELAQKILQIDPFNYSGIRHLCRYYTENNIDSVSAFFDDLMRKHPDKTLPITRRIGFSWYEIGFSDYATSLNFELKYLYKALLIEPKDVGVLCALANKYYYDFIRPNEKSEFDDFFHELEFDTLFPVELRIKNLFTVMQKIVR